MSNFSYLNSPHFYPFQYRIITVMANYKICALFFFCSLMACQPKKEINIVQEQAQTFLDAYNLE